MPANLACTAVSRRDQPQPTCSKSVRSKASTETKPRSRFTAPLSLPPCSQPDGKRPRRTAQSSSSNMHKNLMPIRSVVKCYLSAYGGWGLMAFGYGRGMSPKRTLPTRLLSTSVHQRTVIICKRGQKRIGCRSLPFSLTASVSIWQRAVSEWELYPDWRSHVHDAAFGLCSSCHHRSPTARDR